MKKFIFSLAVLIIIIPGVSFATSGACSYHGGVNCSAGASYSGKVQCNDGWVNSSVYFSEAEECKVSCSYPTQGECDVAYAQQQAQESANRINEQNRLNSIYGGIMPPLVDWTQDSLYLACRNNQELHELQMNIYNRCVSDSSSSYPQSDLTDNSSSYNTTMKNFCITVFGNNTKFENDDCVCNTGYILDEEKKCSLETEVRENFCKKQYGEGSMISPTDNKMCSCLSGYEYNDISKMCEVLKMKQGEEKPIIKNEPIKDSNMVNINEKSKTYFGLKPLSGSSVEQSVEKIIEPVKKLPWYKRLFNWFLGR